MADDRRRPASASNGESESLEITDHLLLKQYADRWLEGRAGLALRTIELYGWLLRKYIGPTFGSVSLLDLTPSAIRSWNGQLAKKHPTTAAKSYRLLSSILRTAVDDELIDRNPCQIRGAAVERAPGRPIATMAEVDLLADAMPKPLRIAIYLAAWCQLRRGEVRGLRRGDVDLVQGTLSVNETRTTTMSGHTVIKAPKTRAGKRTVAIPSNVLALLSSHLDEFVADEPESPVIDATHRWLGVAWRPPDLR